MKGKGDRGGRKGKGESAEGDRKERRGMDGISLPHGRLRTLAALRKGCWQHKFGFAENTKDMDGEDE